MNSLFTKKFNTAQNDAELIEYIRLRGIQRFCLKILYMKYMLNDTLMGKNIIF